MSTQLVTEFTCDYCSKTAYKHSIPSGWLWAGYHHHICPDCLKHHPEFHMTYPTGFCPASALGFGLPGKRGESARYGTCLDASGRFVFDLKLLYSAQRKDYILKGSIYDPKSVQRCCFREWWLDGSFRRGVVSGSDLKNF